jgi:mannose-1-phosphate guanylyltransferase
MKAVILAAGKGTRLLPYSDIIPKPLMPIETESDGSFKPIIDKLISQIRLAGVRDFVVAVNYKAELIMRHLQDGKRLGVRISYVFQGELDGNAGAFYRAQHLIGDEDAIITDSDNYLSDDSVFVEMAELHRSKKAAVTVGVCEVDNPSKYAIIRTDKDGRPIDIFEKPKDDPSWGNLAKSGMMVLSNEIAMMDASISLTDKKEYATTQIIKHCLMKGLPVELYRIRSGFHDIGTWDEYIPILRRSLEAELE